MDAKFIAAAQETGVEAVVGIVQELGGQAGIVYTQYDETASLFQMLVEPTEASAAAYGAKAFSPFQMLAIANAMQALAATGAGVEAHVTNEGPDQCGLILVVVFG